MSEGGNDPDRIGRFFTPDLASAEIEGYAEMARLGQRSEGSLTVTNAILQSYDTGAIEGQAIVRLYACISVAGTRLIGGDGKVVDLSHRPDTATFELAFDLNADIQPPLVISEKGIWQGRSIC
jgi:hypothetical protein